MVAANARQARDTLFFNNGSRVVGELDRIKLGVVSFDPDDANDITVQLQKLKTIAAPTRVFRIETISHKVYFGRMAPCYANGCVTIIAGKDTVIEQLVAISLLYPFRNSFKQRFSGDVSTGFDYTRTSNLGRLNFDGGLAYRSKKEEIIFDGSGIYTITDTSFSRDREDVSIKNNYYFNPTWFGTLLMKYQRNLELGLHRRFQEGVAGGNKFITSKHVYAWTRSGVVFNQEKNNEDTLSGTLTELFAQLEFNFFRFTKPELSINITNAFYYSLSQTGRFRDDAQLDIKWEIVKDLDLVISAYANFDSQPPSAESRKFDMGIDFGLSYSF